VKEDKQRTYFTRWYISSDSGNTYVKGKGKGKGGL